MGRAALIYLGGAACGALALFAAGAPIAGVPWTIAVVLACAGYGNAAMRTAGTRVSLGLTVAVGLAIMLLVATVLARLGLLTRSCQIAVVALGLVAGVAARPELRRPRALEVIAALLGLACVALTLTQQVPVVDDGANHALLLKRLWDTGALGIVYHQAGAQIVGGALLSLATGAHTLTIFDEGLCVALLMLLLASELADGGELGVVAFVLLAVPIALHPMPERGDTGVWAAVLLHVATFRALQGALEARRTGWIAIPLALALAALRHEYLVLAVPYLVAALVLPTRTPSRRAQLVALALWATGLVAMQLAYRSAWPLALGRLVVLLAVVPLTWVASRIAAAGQAPAITVLAFATLGMVVATTATWYGAAICLVMLANVDVAQPARVAVAALGVVVVVGAAIVDVNFQDAARDRIRSRWVDATAMLDELRILGYRVEADHEVAALQRRIPRRATLAFWGQSGGALDFARNPIRDVSWPLGQWRTSGYLDEIDPRTLRRSDFLIVEHVAGNARRDAWGPEHDDPLAQVSGMLAPIAVTSRAALFQVRH
jgi:hypothetical protein